MKENPTSIQIYYGVRLCNTPKFMYFRMYTDCVWGLAVRRNAQEICNIAQTFKPYFTWPICLKEKKESYLVR